MEADKHKFQRFLTADAALVVTVFAPITFPPASVLLFKQRSNGMLNSKWYIIEPTRTSTFLYLDLGSKCIKVYWWVFKNTNFNLLEGVSKPRVMQTSVEAAWTTVFKAG